MSAVGILGGTFDPVHNGHTRIALDIATGCQLERVFMVPNARSPLRDSATASVENRLDMLRRVADSDPRLLVDTRELERPAPSYMVETLQSFRDEMPATSLCFILGMDAFMQFHQWHRWQDIPELAHLIIAHRPGSEMAIQEAALSAMYDERKTDKLDDLHQEVAGHIYLCDVTQVDVSSTTVRECVVTGKPINELVAEPVAEYIKEHRLYQ